VQGASLVCFAGRWRYENAVKRAGETPALRNARLGTLSTELPSTCGGRTMLPLRMLGEIKNNEWATDQRPSPDATFGTRTTRACSSALLQMFGETLRVGLRSANARGQKTR